MERGEAAEASRVGLEGGVRGETTAAVAGTAGKVGKVSGRLEAAWAKATLEVAPRVSEITAKGQ